MNSERDASVDGLASLPATECFRVVLNSGEVKTVGPANAVSLTQDELQLLLDGNLVIAFPRRDVYFATRGTGIAPPVW